MALRRCVARCCTALQDRRRRRQRGTGRGRWSLWRSAVVRMERISSGRRCRLLRRVFPVANGSGRRFGGATSAAGAAALRRHVLSILGDDLRQDFRLISLAKHTAGGAAGAAAAAVISLGMQLQKEKNGK